MENRKFSCSEKLQIIYTDALPSSRWNMTSYSLSAGCVQWFYSEEDSKKRGKQQSFYSGETCQTLPEPGDQGQHQQR